MANPPLNPISFRLPAFDLTTEEGRQQAHRYVASGIVDLNKAIKALKSQLDTTNTTVANNASSASSGPSSSGVISFNTLTGAVTYFPELGMVNDQLGNPSYLTQVSDSGKKIIVGDSVPGVITLNSSVPVPWFAIIDNDSTAPYSLIPSTGTLHGPNVINDSSFGIVFFDGTDFWAGVSGSGGSGGGPAGPPGPTGPTGPAGAPGAPGPFFLIDPDEPPEPVMIPGPPGVAGAAGATGPQGSPGAAILLDPDSPDDPVLIPGPTGPTGPAGATGPAGTGVPVYLEPDSPDEPAMIPGPPGPTGGGGGGAVTSVGLTMPSDFIVGGSPVTSSGTLTVTRGGVFTGNSARGALSGSGTVTATFGPGNPTKGNAILVVLYGNTGVTGPPTDVQGDTFTSVVGTTGGFQLAAFLALNIAGGSTTISVPTTGSSTGFIAYELQNIVGVSGFDVSGYNGSSSGTPWSVTTTATTANPADYLIGTIAIGSGGPYTHNWSSGWTERVALANDVNTNWLGMADENVLAAGSQSVTFNATAGGGLTNGFGLLMIALKVATGVTDFNGQVGHIAGVSSLTTTGSAGAATLSTSGVLNIPNYSVTGALTQIGQVVISGSSTASITFSSIPGSFTNLKLLIMGQTTNAAAQDVLIQFNGDTGSHYDWAYTLGGAITTYTRGNTNNDTAMHLGSLNQSSLTDKAGATEITIHGYANASFYKQAFALDVGYSSGATGMVTTTNGGEWQSTAAVTSIKITLGSSSNFAAGTTATLYGML